MEQTASREEGFRSRTISNNGVAISWTRLVTRKVDMIERRRSETSPAHDTSKIVQRFRARGYPRLLFFRNLEVLWKLEKSRFERQMIFVGKIVDGNFKFLVFGDINLDRFLRFRVEKQCY